MEQNIKLYELVDKFADELKQQLREDEKRWGDTWKRRPKEGQELRVFARFDDYKDQFINGGIPINWLKVAGEALICWFRDSDKQ